MLFINKVYNNTKTLAKCIMQEVSYFSKHHRQKMGCFAILSSIHSTSKPC